MAVFYYLIHKEHPYSIHTVFVPVMRDVPGQSNAFMTETDCHQTNQWECAFLPLTYESTVRCNALDINRYCPVPLEISNCVNTSCIDRQNDKYLDGFSIGFIISCDDMMMT